VSATLHGGPADGTVVDGDPDGVVIIDIDQATGEQVQVHYRRDMVGRLVPGEPLLMGGE
jgi:hypothetical protein